MNGYVIQVAHKADFPLFLRTRETSLSAYTRYIEEAKVYRTRDGAERWVTARGSDSPFVVVAVALKRQRSGRVTPALEA